MNGDGYADVVAGAPYYDGGQTDEGRAYVYRGSASGLGASADRMVESDMSWAYLGASVGAAGDVNGDGYADVIVGACQYASGEMREGNAFVYYGSGAAYTTQTTTIRYTYDPLQRLTGAGYSGATTYTFAYAYDAVGNRTIQTQTLTSTLVTTYTYDAANRLTNAGGVTYTWDDNGNLTNDGSKVYTYTQANRLMAVSGTGLNWSATYNGDGARLKQVVNNMLTTYTQDLASPLPVVLQAQTGTTATLYLFDMGTGPLAEYDSAWEYLLPDGLGSVRQLVDAGGNVKLTEVYEPYGSVLTTQGSATSAFGFTGEQLDSYIELMFLRARYMQPGLGVFLSRDPWQGDTLHPLTYNGWAYVDGNPINRNDPSGYCGGGGPSGSKARVCGTTAAGYAGVKFRAGPSTQATYDRELPDGTQIQLLSGIITGDGLNWRQVSVDGGAGGAPVVGYVADMYLEPAFGGGGTPSTGLAGFRLGRLFRQRNYDISVGYGDPTWGAQNWLPDLGRNGHNGVDLAPVPEVTVNECANNVVGREVLSPVNGDIVNIWNQPPNYDGSIPPPEKPNNPPGISLDFANIHGYPDVKIQLSHVYPSPSSRQPGPVRAGEIIGYYAQIGFSYGPHLHLTMKWKNSLINPEPYLPPLNWNIPE